MALKALSRSEQAPWVVEHTAGLLTQMFAADEGMRALHGLLGRAASGSEIGQSTASVRVTQFYHPSRGVFGPGASTALSSPAPASWFGRVVDGPTSSTWVAPRGSGEMNWFSRMLTGRGRYTNFVEFSVSPAELRNPGGVKFFYAPFQKIIPGTVDLAGRDAVFGRLAPNYGQRIFIIVLGSGTGTAIWEWYHQPTGYLDDLHRSGAK